jgi:hypothetical protein
MGRLKTLEQPELWRADHLKKMECHERLDLSKSVMSPQQRQKRYRQV